MAETYDEYLGVVVRTHGLDGTIVLDDAAIVPTAPQPGCIVMLGFSREYVKPYTIESFIQTPQRTVVRFREVTTAEAANLLLEHAVYCRAEDVGVEADNRYRIGDIEGCSVITVQGHHLGLISEVWLMPANDVWVVQRSSGSTIPLPVIDAVVKTVDLDSRTITVNLLPGLLELEDDTEADDAE